MPPKLPPQQLVRLMPFEPLVILALGAPCVSTTKMLPRLGWQMNRFPKLWKNTSAFDVDPSACRGHHGPIGLEVDGAYGFPDSRVLARRSKLLGFFRVAAPDGHDCRRWFQSICNCCRYPGIPEAVPRRTWQFSVESLP